MGINIEGAQYQCPTQTHLKMSDDYMPVPTFLRNKQHLVKLALAARRSARAANKASEKWISAFESFYGHSDISDILVDVIDNAHGVDSDITADFIEQHSAAGQS